MLVNVFCFFRWFCKHVRFLFVRTAFSNLRCLCLNCLCEIIWSHRWVICWHVHSGCMFACNKKATHIFASLCRYAHTTVFLCLWHHVCNPAVLTAGVGFWPARRVLCQVRPACGPEPGERRGVWSTAHVYVCVHANSSDEYICMRSYEYVSPVSVSVRLKCQWISWEGQPERGAWANEASHRADAGGKNLLFCDKISKVHFESLLYLFWRSISWISCSVYFCIFAVATVVSTFFLSRFLLSRPGSHGQRTSAWRWRNNWQAVPPAAEIEAFSICYHAWVPCIWFIHSSQLL